jgi:hypothetical protein
MSRFACLALAPLAIACTADSDYPEMGGDYGTMRGELLTVHGVNDVITNAWGDFTPEHSYLEVHALGDYGWVMINLDVMGELGVGDLGPGNTYTWSNSLDSDENSGSDEPVGTSVGCSGPAEWQFEYDDMAEEVEVSIVESPDTSDVVVEIVADHGDAGTVSASVNLASLRR